MRSRRRLRGREVAVRTGPGRFKRLGNFPVLLVAAVVITCAHPAPVLPPPCNCALVRTVACAELEDPELLSNERVLESYKVLPMVIVVHLLHLQEWARKVEKCIYRARAEASCCGAPQ